MKMEPYEIIHKAREQGRSNLTEAEAKILLSFYGVPVVRESIVADENDALEQAGTIGFPLVLKGMGTNLAHKTERELVKVNLRSDEEVRQAYRQVRESAGADWEKCLIQPMVEGKREFVAGLFRDVQFGPVVMFGLGGIFTEAIADVVFRIAPVTKRQATGMMEELSSRKLLTDFRGEAAADREQFIRTLMGLSQLGMEHPEIAEVDINPLIVMRDGRVTAVDALVVINEDDSAVTDGAPSETEAEAKERVGTINAALDVMTHPKSIAVIGAKRSQGKLNLSIFDCIANFGFSGNLYPINPNVTEISGYRAYPDLRSLPERVDLVIISVPAPLVPQALRECVATENKNIHIFSAGFRETAEEVGVGLHKEIETIAQEGRLHVIGPNCMGLYVPASNIVTWPGASEESGPMAFVSQSGGHAQDFTKHAHNSFGINVSKVISYGNALTLDGTDFLEYLAQDDDTRIVGMYLEGIKDGRKLLRLITAINRTKPVIVLKAGLTDSGARAAASHTGSLAGSDKIWNAFFRQSGAVRVDSLEEMAEVAQALLHCGECSGRRLAVIGSGGGISVAAADECSKVGLYLPDLSPELVTKLRRFIPPAGNMIRNPIDHHSMFSDLDILGHTIELVSEESHADMFVISLHLDWLHEFSGHDESDLKRIAGYIATKARTYCKGKPLVVSWRQYADNPETHQWSAILGQALLQGGVPCYRGLSRGLIALSKLAEYHESLRANK